MLRAWWVILPAAAAAVLVAGVFPIPERIPYWRPVLQRGSADSTGKSDPPAMITPESMRERQAYAPWIRVHPSLVSAQYMSEA